MARTKKWTDHPRCLYCGRKLRKNKFPRPGDRSPYGDYGDGRFCGISHGFYFANIYLDNHSEKEARMKEVVIKFMNEQEGRTK